MLNKLKLFHFFVLFLILCGHVFAQRFDTIAEHYKTWRYNCAIFSANDSNCDFHFRGYEKRFTPTHANIDRTEHSLRQHKQNLDTLSSNRYRYSGIRKKLGKYRKQYLGFINERGHHILYINCFRVCKEDEDDFDDWWLKRIIRVCDGGDNFWSVKFDLDTGTFFDLYIHGRA